MKERYILTKKGSEKDTRHIVLDLEGSGLSYLPGDSVGVLPRNSSKLVEATLKAAKASGDEQIVTKQGVELPFKEFLFSYTNLKGINRKLIQEINARGGDVADLLQEQNKEMLKEWIQSHEMWDLLKKFPHIHFTPQEIVDLSMPLLPRFYSIASSQSLVGNEVHLTVAHLKYETQGIERIGTCTHYLCEVAHLNAPIIPIYIQSGGDFRLPEHNETSIIMIGPGTGVAPFRAFMQEREAREAKGKNWLFFGEWTRQKEYFYEKEWADWSAQGLLKISTAFSRDQADKVYVQHRMLEAAPELYQWLEDGAVLYVCGDLHHMAKDVDVTLHKIVQQQGSLSEESAKEYVKKLRQSKRYLRDIY